MRIPILALAALAGASALVSAQAPMVGGAPRFVAIGCLTKQAVAGRGGPTSVYQVTDARGDRPTVYVLNGDRALFEQHVGHQVEAAGSIAHSPVAERLPVELKVTSLVYIAKTCAKR